MKILQVMSAVFLSALGLQAANYYAENIPHSPVLHVALATNIAAMRTAFTNWPYYSIKLVTVEGGQSDPYSAAQGASDYYAVYLKTNAFSGRLLQITMNESFSGMLDVPIIVDATTRQQFNVSLTRYDTRSGDYDFTADTNGYLARLYHLGTLNIDGETIFVRVRYSGTPRYPSIQLTWGQGATNGVTGFFEDHLEGNSTRTNSMVGRPQIRWSTMAYVDNEVDPIFPVTIAEVTSERAYSFEATSDLKTWHEADSVYVGINTDSNHQVWGIIHDPGTDKQFVRMRTTE